ncbi:hypothetical protein [Buttiauxella noackiae]|uniref:hypothetical protein n=1 Tax=Buttiauxella noackiae TaxID=82992 RepID=UPI0028D65B84|nr:hypothetical protein [Buttiauxella noackiae]
MSEVTDLTVIEIKPEQAPVLYAPNGLDAFLEQIKQEVNEVPDLSTAKGRARVASLAAQVSRSKTAIEKPGRDYLKRLKELPKEVEAELRRFVTECDTIRDETRRPLTEWEAEQERIAAENQMLAWHEEALEMNSAFNAAAKLNFETDHEMALLMDAAFDRDAAEKAAEAERQRIAHEEELKRQAAEQAKREAAEAAQREIDAAAARERDATLAKERAEREAKEAADLAERNRIAAEQKAEADRKAAAEKAERDKQEAIAEEKRKAQAEADRIKREADEKEAARLAEEKRIADEAAARAANEKHRKVVGTEIVSALLGHTSLTREQAIEVLVALKDELIPRTRITY